MESETASGVIFVSCEAFRILRSPDKKCWIYQEWTMGGIKTGTGKRGPDHWATVGYYGKLEDLAIYLVNRQIKAPDIPFGSVVELRAEIKAAEARIAEELRLHFEAQPETV